MGFVTNRKILRGSQTANRVKGVCVATLLVIVGGCTTWRSSDHLPDKSRWELGPLTVYADFRLPRQHRLLDDVVALRTRLGQRLAISPGDQPINVYLFDDPRVFRRVLQQRFPELADRRALFLKTDTQLAIFGQWGDTLAEDLRHEATHAYLHSVIPDLPLWLDEGLAEYFEVASDLDGFHERHIDWLVDQYRQRLWSPNLHRLESLSRPQEMTQTDYAEAWLWVHFMQHDSPETLAVLRESLAELQATSDAQMLVSHLLDRIPEAGGRLLDHLHELSQSDGGTTTASSVVLHP